LPLLGCLPLPKPQRLGLREGRNCCQLGSGEAIKVVFQVGIKPIQLECLGWLATFVHHCSFIIFIPIPKNDWQNMHPQIQPHQESTQDVEAALQSFYSTKVATQEAMEKPWENRGFLEFVGFPQFEINEISRDFKKAQILF